MPASHSPARVPATFPWWLVLCLVGLDYFSTLAYLPSIAVQAAGSFAPVAAVAVVAVTLLIAVPVYLYVVGRSPDGHGATGLLDQHVRGWLGKLLLLILLGFVATDFVITRTLSVADAAAHLIANPTWHEHADWVDHNRETVRAALPEFLRKSFFELWNEQLIVTVALSILCFVFWSFLQKGFTKTFLRLGALVVVLYLSLTGLIVGSGLFYLSAHPQIFDAWWQNLGVGERKLMSLKSDELLGALAFLSFLSFPQLALGLSGFELSMATAPLVRGNSDEDPHQPRGRVRRTQLMMVVAALVMGVFLLGSVFVTTLLIPEAASITGSASHRSLAYLAHGESLVGETAANAVNPWFGATFGTVYDLSTIAILCLAGASSALGIKELVPYYLARYGMQLHWAQRTNVILHLFNLIVLVITVGFRANVMNQQWAYATSVLVLLSSAAVAASLDVRSSWRRSFIGFILAAPFAFIALFFLVMVVQLVAHHPSGLAIALSFVAVTVVTAFGSRWVRSTELRFEGFTFADEQSKERWNDLCKLDFQVLVPHRPGLISLQEKEREIRSTHRLDAKVPILFIEVEKGDTSDFMNSPLLKIGHDDNREVIHVSRCASVAHVLAAIGLAWREVGRPPEIHFGWSDESPLAANLNFLLLGEGNVPWMVQSLIRKAEPNPARRPRVIVG